MILSQNFEGVVEAWCHAARQELLRQRHMSIPVAHVGAMAASVTSGRWSLGVLCSSCAVSWQMLTYSHHYQGLQYHSDLGRAIGKASWSLFQGQTSHLQGVLTMQAKAQPISSSRHHCFLRSARKSVLQHLAVAGLTAASPYLACRIWHSANSYFAVVQALGLDNVRFNVK